MTIELTCLAWATILGLVHILVTANVRTKELGIKWNMSARDGVIQPTSMLVGRLLRAQSNFFETYPFFVSAVLIVAFTHSFSGYTYWGSIIYLTARIIYFPLYVMGIPMLRSLVWLTSIIGLLFVLVPLLF